MIEYRITEIHTNNLMVKWQKGRDMRVNNPVSPVIFAKESHGTLDIVRLLRFRVPKWARSEAVPENRCQFDIPIPASCRGLVDKRHLVWEDDSMLKGVEAVGQGE